MSLKTILLLVLSILSYGIYAQSSPSVTEFPIQGTYSVAVGPDEQMRGYDQVIIKPDAYLLLKNGIIKRHYVLVSVSNEIYAVEHYIDPRDISSKHDKSEFSFKIDQCTESECLISLIWSNRTEKLRLIKTQ